MKSLQLCQPRRSWMENLEQRFVLSAPPVLAGIPAVLHAPEFTEPPYARYYYFQATATDPDSLPSQLVFRRLPNLP